MKTQISRDGYDPEKRYSGVYQQQGSLLTDRDWNEMVDVLKGRIDEGLAHAVGNGLPRGGAVEILPGPQGPAIRPGTVYAEGVTAEVAPAAGAAVPFRYDQQADFPSPPALPSGQAYFLYADVWERPVLALEDEGLRDRALTGATDPSTRTQTLAQIKWAPESIDPEDTGQNPPRGDAVLTVSVPSTGGIPQPDTETLPEAVDPLGRDVLFRLEVHDVIWPAGASPEAWSRIVLKWSRENGARQYRYLEAPVAFRTGTWVYELYEPEAEKHLGYSFGSWTPRRGTFSPAFPVVSGEAASRSFVRRWDGYCVISRTNNTNPHLPAFQFDQNPATTAPGSVVTLASGIEAEGEEPSGDGDLTVKIGQLRLDLDIQGAVLLPGDSWQVPVRRAGYLPGSQIPVDRSSGVTHRYVTLATVSATGTVTPRRATFPSLTGLQASDIGYDGSGAANGLFDSSHDTVKKALDRLWSLGAGHARYTKPANSGLYKDKTVADVKQALDLLSDVRARQIAYEARTGVPDPQTALDALFNRSPKLNGWTIVGGGGQYPSVGAAITALLAEQRSDLRLWLMPGDHDLALAQPLKSPDLQAHLTLAGSGWASRLLLKGEVSIQDFASMTFQGLALEFDSSATLLLSGGEISFVNNRISGTSGTGLIQTGPSPRTLFRDNIVEASQTDPAAEPAAILAPLDTAITELFSTRPPRLFALRARALYLRLRVLTLAVRQQRADAIQANLDQRPDIPTGTYKTLLTRLRQATLPVDIETSLASLRAEALQRALPGTFLTLADARSRALLESNQIYGYVSLYGKPGGDLSAADLQSAIQRLASITFDPQADQDFVARNNRLSGFRVAASMVQQIRTQNSLGPLYRWISLSNNTIEAGGNQLLAGTLSLASSFLSTAAFGWIVGEELLFAGNVARINVTIETLSRTWAATGQSGRVTIHRFMPS